MYLVVAAGGHYVLENPQGSLITLHDRYVQFLHRLLSLGVTVPFQHCAACVSILCLCRLPLHECCIAN